MEDRPYPPAGIEWRVEQIERRIAKLEELDTLRGEILARMDERQNGLSTDVKSVARDMGGVKRALYGLLFSLTIAIVASAIDIATRVSAG